MRQYSWGSTVMSKTVNHRQPLHFIYHQIIHIKCIYCVEQYWEDIEVNLSC